MNTAAALKRAAKHNPAWKPARIYQWAYDDNGDAILQDGMYVFDIRENTFAYIDRYKQEDFTVSNTYQGDTVLNVITEHDPNIDDLILLGGIWYALKEVQATDGFGATVRYLAMAIDQDEIVHIREDTVYV